MNAFLRGLRFSRLAIIAAVLLLPVLLVVSILLSGIVDTWSELSDFPAEIVEAWPRRGWFGPKA